MNFILSGGKIERILFYRTMSEIKNLLCLRLRPLLYLILLSSSLFLCASSMSTQNTSALVDYFKSHSIPAESVTVKDDVVTIKVNYEDHEDRTIEEKKNDLITIAQKSASEFPSSGVILIEQFIGQDKVVEMGWKTQDITDFKSGLITQDEFMKKMKMNFAFDIETKLAADVPRIPAPKAPVMASVNTSSGGGGGPAYRSGLDSGWIVVIVVFSFLFILSAVAISLLMRRRQPPAQLGSKISATLNVYYADGAQKKYLINKSRLILGRSSSCSITITDPEASARHAEIFVYKRHFYLKDLGSANGTSINGQKILECALYAGDEIRVGTTRLIFGA